MSILIFFVVLFVLILVHEWGHFIVAKKSGMQVDEFGIGFPPKLFGVKWGGTEYTINLLPIGGFVKILGEDSLIVGDDKDSSKSFIAKNRWQQAAVLVAGVTMNILFAWLLFVLVFMIGVSGTVAENEASEAATLTVTEVLPASPAEAAGLEVGMTILSIQSGTGSLANPTPTAFSEFVSAHAADELHILVDNAGQESTVSVTATEGLIEADSSRPAVGVALALVETKSYSFLAAIKEGTLATFSTLVAIFIGVLTLLGQAVTWSADLSQVAGPVGIVGLVGQAAAFGLTSLMTFTAVISLNLAVINLLPLPALDGGRLLFVAIEGVTRRHINPVWMARVNLVGFSLLILLMVLITINDVFYK